MGRVKVILVILAILLTFPIISVAYDIEFPFSGVWSWNSTTNTSMFVSIAGGGGSGASSGAISGYTTYGQGGSAGEYGNITMVTVTPHTLYVITVGAAGAQAIPNIYGPGSPSNSTAGGDSDAFGNIKHGGAGGLMGGATTAPGGVGASTNFMSAASASSGGAVTGAAGGLGGVGYGAGGGGAGGNTTFFAGTYGGAGKDGYVRLWDMNGSGANIPYYTASPTSAGYGSIVTFTDQSILNDAGSLVYQWDFGDGEHSHTIGTVTHVYNTYGVFSTNLSITSTLGSVYLNKTDYITVSAVPITAWYQQKLVQLKLVDAFGNDLEGANITVAYITNSLPSKDPGVLTSAFGVSQSVANQMVSGSVGMQAYSDSDGSAVFMMFPAIQYGITISNITTGLSKYITLYPQDTQYIIYCPLPSQAAPTSRATALYNASLYVTSPNASWIVWNLYYSDTELLTYDLIWNVTCLNNGTVMYSKEWSDGPYPHASPMSILRYPIVDNYTFPSVPAGVEYQALYSAERRR